MQINQLWDSGIQKLTCQPDESQLIQLKQYVELLNRWNKTYNLTAVRDLKSMIPLHIFDSLILAELIKGNSCLDVGSGAGLPSIPLAIIQADRQFTALDTNGK
ncbi:MAG TPA: 16S rRNA (guanine(527)-N(7))-methyltransferase RsmG, partial [Leucothrix sp.]|nr:16S rRNA (guanine(527)-N(7))-methyltransferase RsmG [Leucothrix sp.]